VVFRVRGRAGVGWSEPGDACLSSLCRVDYKDRPLTPRGRPISHGPRIPRHEMIVSTAVRCSDPPSSIHHPRPGIYNAVLRSDRFGTGHRLGILRLRADPRRSQITSRRA